MIDFQPGSLLIDFVPWLEYLPKFLQPWRRTSSQLRARELRIYGSLFCALKRRIETEGVADCFGSVLLKVE